MALWPLSFLPGRAPELSSAFFKWPNATKFDTVFGHMARVHPGRFLVESPFNPRVLPSHRQTLAVVVEYPEGSCCRPATASVCMSVPRRPSGLRPVHKAEYFSLVALKFLSSQGLDHRIAADLNGNHSYRIVAHVPYGVSHYTIWARIQARAGQR